MCVIATTVGKICLTQRTCAVQMLQCQSSEIDKIQFGIPNKVCLLQTRAMLDARVAQITV